MKKIMLAMVAIMATAVLWAFHQQQPKTGSNFPPSPVWFYYDGSGDPNDQENYTLEPQSTDCSGSIHPCAILAEPDGTDPNLPDQNDVNAASASSSNFTIETALIDLKA